MPAPTQTSAVVNVNNGGSTSTVTMTGVVAGSTLMVVLPAFRFSTPDGALVTGVSSSNGGALTLARSRLRNSDNGGNQHRLGVHVFLLQNAAAGSHTLTVTFANATGNYADWFSMEVPGLMTSGALDASASTDGAFVHGVSSVSVISGALAEALSMAVVVAAGQGASSWNGSTTAPFPAPSGGWIALRGKRYGASLDGVPFQASYLDTSSVAALTASWTVPNDSVSDGFITAIVVLRLAAGGNYVEILLQPDTEDGVAINGTSGWIVHVAPADPKDGYVVYSGVAAQVTGNEIRVQGAGGTTAVGGTVNVQVINAALNYTSGWGVGTVRAAA
jgi:hypothetical protein